MSGFRPVGVLNNAPSVHRCGGTGSAEHRVFGALSKGSRDAGAAVTQMVR